MRLAIAFFEFYGFHISLGHPTAHAHSKPTGMHLGKLITGCAINQYFLIKISTVIYVVYGKQYYCTRLEGQVSCERRTRNNLSVLRASRRIILLV